MININNSSIEQLTHLDGIGLVLAQRIVEYREVKGDFETTKDIMNVYGIGEGIYSKIVNNITV